MPHLVGLTQAAAQTVIDTAHLTLGTLTRVHHATIPAGVVINQRPAAGATVPKGTAVELDLSLGPDLVTVPDLTGQAKAAARTALVNADLALAMSPRPPGPPCRPDRSSATPTGRPVTKTPPTTWSSRRAPRRYVRSTRHGPDARPDRDHHHPMRGPVPVFRRHPIQTGVAPGTVRPARAVLRGKVLTSRTIRCRA